MAKIDKLTKRAKEHLDTSEEIVATVQGSYEGERAGMDALRTGIFIATDKRVILYSKKMFGYELEFFPIPASLQ